VNILTLNIGLGSSVCLVVDGKIAFAIQEERLSRIKNHMGFPELCIKYLKSNYGHVLDCLDFVGLAGYNEGLFTKEEFLKKYEVRGRLPAEKTFYERFLKPHRDRIFMSLPEELKDRLKPQRKKISGDTILSSLLKPYSIDRKKIVRINHHDCHAAAAYFGLAKDPEKKYLVFTLDGGGDAECASISTGHRGRLTRIATTPSGNSIGNLYSNITYLMGFTPHEHEYKLMGMAPYVPEKHSRPVFDILSKYITLDPENPLIFKRLTQERTTWATLLLEKDLRLMRLDNITAGLQLFTEHIVISWIKEGIKQSGIHNILLSGGVFMNVKVNQKISLLDEVESVDVFPSCGDESNSLGCAFMINSQNNGCGLFDFGQYTLGPKPDYDLEEAKAKFGDACEFRQVEDPCRVAAELIAQGKIVARCSGQMEFGARALGNRSILGDPINLDLVEKVNFLIKQRDFWMPFAPAVLKEDVEKYLKVPSTLPPNISPYMMFTFDTTDLYPEMIACIHRADKTARAQIVSKELYPDLHRLITNFKDITGRSAIMNTSFNIHGHPIVMGSVDAIEILVNSNLDYVIIEDILVTKR
jgi:carbamoyltransferase